MASNAKPTVVHGIFQRLSIVKSDRALRGLINEYVDQSSKKNAIDPAKAVLAYPKDEEYTALKNRKQLPQRPGMDFVPSLHSAPVFVGGFLTKMAPQVDLADPTQLPTGLAQIGSAWCERTDERNYRAHHLLFSIKEDLQARCLRLGIPVQDVLMASAVGAMNRFSAWAFPASNLG